MNLPKDNALNTEVDKPVLFFINLSRESDARFDTHQIVRLHWKYWQMFVYVQKETVQCSVF